MTNDIVENRLEIIIVTYNRKKYLERTLGIFLSESSPVRNCKITVLDNNSGDETEDAVASASKCRPNVRYRKNRYNLGISGNIFRAMELAKLDYVWIVGDDDCYDFSSWSEVAAMMESGEKVICLSRYILPDDRKCDLAAQLVQITFITGCIYSTSLFDDTSIRDSIYNVYTLFPHMVPVVRFVNHGGHIGVVGRAIADNGLLLGEDKDCSYNRGVRDVSDLSPRTRCTQWIVGWAAICNMIGDRALRERTLERGVEVIHGNFGNLANALLSWYPTRRLSMLVAELYAIAPVSWLKKLPFTIKYTANHSLTRYRLCKIFIPWHRERYEKKIKRILEGGVMA